MNHQPYSMRHRRLRRRLIATLLSAMLGGHAVAAPGGAPEDVEFDPSFFPSGGAPKVDLSRFSRGNVNMPGAYRGDTTVNNIWVGRGDITLESVPGHESAQLCFTPDMLLEWGVAVDKLEALPVGRSCGDIVKYVPGATATFDPGEQSLAVDIPQVYMSRSARGYVPPSQWDPGINAALLNYSSNVYQASGGAQRTTSGYLGLDGSINLKSWHLVHSGSLSWQTGSGRQYQATQTNLQHDIPGLMSQIVVGDTFTEGNFFDSVRVRGLRLASDDRMLPQSMRGYAPTVRGVAETNAHVVIRQRGYVIYDTTVAPGPFEIDDLYPTGYGGNLSVEVREADGRVRQFEVAFAALPQLLRPGQSRYSVTTGRVQELNLHAQPFFLQGTYQRGLTNHWTGYSGFTIANGYRSFLGGAAVGTPLGAFSLDLTRSRNQAPGASAMQGSSLRLGYNKNVIDIGTNIGIAAYRYNTEGYVGLRDAVAMRDRLDRELGDGRPGRDRSRLDVNVAQTLNPGWGQLYVNGSLRQFYGRSGQQKDFSAGYSNALGKVTYSFSVQRTRDSGGEFLRPALPGRPATDGFFGDITPGRRDTRWFLNMSIPLGENIQAPTLAANASRDSGQPVNASATLSGLAGRDNRYSYAATLNHTGRRNAVDVNGQYRGSAISLAAGAGHGSEYRQVNAGASGSLVAHSDGFTFGSATSETTALVHAPGATGASISGGQGAVIDSRGYALSTYLQPYELNTITLDPKGARQGLEVDNTTVRVAPRYRSVVLLKFNTQVGRAVLVDTSAPGGLAIPFGADVFDSAGKTIGVVGQASRLYIRDMRESGNVTVRWGDDHDQACSINVELGGHAANDDTMPMIKAPCQATAVEPLSKAKNVEGKSP
ncbi:fimbria/pilus outer membrane usher protein [Pinirhizobacter sp.]|uniref:fimbria/pilus outer membrane usher protein n=1 Tax=Pinirhizobacter sp. TaxID=2950432 RepID=UPI002F3F8C36